MIYLYAYFGIGVFTLVIVVAADRIAKMQPPDAWSALWTSADPAPETFWHHVFEKVLLPVLAAPLVIVAWPIAVYMKVSDLLGAKQPFKFEPERVFAVERAHLQERLSLREVEHRETIHDPLGAVPQLPFGHLHAAWLAFVEQIGADDELWSFLAEWKSQAGHPELRLGYVAVRNCKPRQHFLTMRKSLDEMRPV